MIYKASQVFTGNEMLHNSGVKVENGIIKSILTFSEITNNEEITDFGDVMLAPAFIDIQLYGAYGRLLSVYPDAETVAAIAKYSREGGAGWCLPTIATNPYTKIFKCIDAIKDFWQQGGQGVIGLHVEGPWLNPLKKGAHKEDWIFTPTIFQVKELLDYGQGVIKMITLAPEIISDDVMDVIKSYDVIISAGHSNATYEQATHAFNNGIHTATHLYNAMSPLLHRSPGFVGAVFDHSHVLCSLVPDGYHVDYAAIRIAKAVMRNRLFVITDAVTETNEGFYQHKFEEERYTSNGILSGSALTMYKAFLRLVRHCGISVAEALRMCSLYPAEAIKMTPLFGTIKVNARADMIILDKELQFKKLILVKSKRKTSRERRSNNL